MAQWGATPELWAHFKRVAKVDLLPVVSNPDAPIDPDSKMKALGKTPSRYTAKRTVVGIPKWTEHEATVPEIERWAAEPDYGICVQTRRIRALDIDVDDAELSIEILADFEEVLLAQLPVRTRANSGKRLAVFILEGEIGKRSFHCERGLVEFLATKQQFVAAGTHPSGARYEWPDGLPQPEVISLSMFERAWAYIYGKYAVGVERRVDLKERRLGADLDLDDPVAQHLEAHWETYGVERGKLYVRCPWKDGHSVESGDSETAWLLAGTNGHRKGHFECLHASCQGRSDGHFFEAVGYKLALDEDFEDLAAQYAALAKAEGKSLPEASPKPITTASHGTPPALPLPGFMRDKNGTIETTLDNVARALRSPEACHRWIAYDNFRAELMIAETPGEWRPFEDADAVWLRVELESGLEFKNAVGKELMRDALTMIGRERQFDSAITWLTEVIPAWDGVPRIARFFPDLFGTEDTPYTEAVGRYLWTALAGRVLEPGIKADMVPVLVGEQGARKSSGIMAMVPSEEFYAEFDLEARDDDNSRMMRGTLVGELAELRGLNGRDAESIKAWITRRFEKWTQKYKEYQSTFARRLIFIGTTNDDDFLNDPTGERRWLPMQLVGKVVVELIEAERDQLWAEARETFLAGGIQWQDAERLAKAEHHRFKHVDAWQPRVSAWLDEPDDFTGVAPRASGCLQAETVLAEALGLDPAKIQRKDQMRIAKVLKACGLQNRQQRLKSRVATSVQKVATGVGANVKVWFDPTLEDLV